MVFRGWRWTEGLTTKWENDIIFSAKELLHFDCDGNYKTHRTIGQKGEF